MNESRSGTKLRALAPFLFACAACAATKPSPRVAPQPPEPVLSRVHFRLHAPDGFAPRSGRVVVSMTDAPSVADPRAPGAPFAEINATWSAAAHVVRLAPREPIEIDPDSLASPEPLSRAPRGTWKIAATFRADDADDVDWPGRPTLASAVVSASMDPAHAGAIDLTFAAAPTPPRPVDSDFVKIVRAPSARLSAFYGRPVTFDAIVLLPASYATDPKRSYGTVYSLPGFSGTVDRIARHDDELRKTASFAAIEAVHVIVPGMTGTGHHAFADSVNDGPWGSAFVDELVPFIEQRFRVARSPAARVLGGHSSGGWSSLWLMITHPDAFAATWSTSPDPVDLRDFTGVDVTPGSSANFFTAADGSARGFLRLGGKDTSTIERYFRWEQVIGGVGAMGTFEWVFSPRGANGLPLPLFDRATGALVQETLRAWEAFDVRKAIDARWATLGPKLQNGAKLHLFCGGADNFHLEGALARLCDALKAKGSDAVCEIVPGRDHFDLLGSPNARTDLATRIDREKSETLARAVPAR